MNDWNVYICERCGDYNVTIYADNFKCRHCGGCGNEFIGRSANPIDLIKEHRLDNYLTDSYDVYYPRSAW